MKEIKELADFTGSDGYLAVDGLDNDTAGGKKKLSDVQPLVLHAVTEEDPENPGKYNSHINYDFDDLLTKVKSGTPLTVILDGPIYTEYHDPFGPPINYTYVISDFQIAELSINPAPPGSRSLVGHTIHGDINGKVNIVRLFDVRQPGVIPIDFQPYTLVMDVSEFGYAWPAEEIGWDAKWGAYPPEYLELSCNGMKTTAHHIAYMDGNDYYACQQCRHENGTYSLSPITFYHDVMHDTMHGTFPFFSDQ